jgi:hypothetical protein
MPRSVRALTSRDAVLAALRLHDELGQEEFLRRHGFGRSYRYQLVHDGCEYDSKAVAGVAYGMQHPDAGPLRSSEFSGGRSGAAFALQRLGFEIRADGAAPPAVTTRVVHRAATPQQPAPVHATPEEEDVVLLVGCVKTKLTSPAPAQDLYVSDLFRKRRRYVEERQRPWFILSALHGLVAPEAVLEPYDMALGAQPVAYRQRWGRQIVAALAQQLGDLRGRTFEVHAGAPYVQAIRPTLVDAGARVLTPLAGLTQGQQLSWYLKEQAALPPAPASRLELALSTLTDHGSARSPAGFPWGRTDLAAAGLYAWHLDDEGAHTLSTALGDQLAAGLVYAGQAGATAWPSGTQRSSTLLTRVGGNHLRGGIRSSTWRRTLSALLCGYLDLQLTNDELTPPSHARLSRWMEQRLRLSLHPVQDRDGLGELEHQVLTQLDPPLNLEGMPHTPVRARLTSLRASLARGHCGA